MSGKNSLENFFEDFQLGRVFDCPTPRVLTEADRVAYISFTGDRTPQYCDSSGRVHPLIVFHTVLGQTVRQISLNAVANLGYAELIWHDPVFVNDQISTEVEVIGLKENSNGKSGIVYVRTQGRNQAGNPVLSYFRWVMVRKRGTGPTPFLNSPVLPKLRKELGPADLRTETGHHSSRGPWLFDDYTVGERILHTDGMTINSSDHMSFTRLYQNSARVHFDAIKTGGTPLVYGGLVISIGYAAAFNGLENRLGIAAINSGNHANPVHAGDTLYSFTDVLAKEPLNDSVGTIRLRLIVLKNTDPTSEFEPEAAGEADRPRLADDVALDLDYWELFPRR